MNEELPPYSFDVLIAGAGFAGTLTALMLHQSGFKVAVVERGSHPRFTIGESSTPIADMILRDIAQKYNLPWLGDFSRYGSWQQTHPEIICGLKRGFSYFKQFPNKKFATDAIHTNELLVAASADNQQSDTNWLRADIDAFLVRKLGEYKITYFDQTEIRYVKRREKWEFQAVQNDGGITLQASFFIDATGSGKLVEQLFDIRSTSAHFLTNSHALYSHFEGVNYWGSYLKDEGIPSRDYPYDPDYSALHHVLEEGWAWMLRFKNGLLSMGFMLNESYGYSKGKPVEEIWAVLLAKYPSLKGLMANAMLAQEPGKLIQTGRLQRRLERAFGHGWVALPHTIGFVDPLHSTGIAHTLTGVEKVVKILCDHWNTSLLNKHLIRYQQSVFHELKFVDLLVAGCYKCLSHFQLFSTWTMLYFTAAIAYEQKRLKGIVPTHFLEANNSYLNDIVQESYEDLVLLLNKKAISNEDVKQFVQMIRKRIKPYNTAGLLDPTANNMYRHTSVNF